MCVAGSTIRLLKDDWQRGFEFAGKIAGTGSLYGVRT